MLEPDMDPAGYPTASTLSEIELWLHTDYTGLMKYVRRAWHFDDWGWRQEKEKNDLGRRVRRYHISTGGWSGNEQIISSLMRNQMFWMVCWLQSRRGGHYIFEVPINKEKDNGKKGKHGKKSTRKKTRREKIGERYVGPESEWL